VSVLGTVARSIHINFHGLQESEDELGIQRFLTITVLHLHSAFARPKERSPIPKRQNMDCGRSRFRNINLIPIRHSRLRNDLGPTNPRLMIIVEETLPIRWIGFSPYLRYYSCQDPYSNAVDPTSRPSFCPRTTPPYEITFLCSEVSEAGLSPVHFRRPQSRLVICYELFKGWLLLSQPPSCFRSRTTFHVTLNRHLGPLTSGWVFPLLNIRLIPTLLIPASTTTTAS
jgi:hypothetical protein